MSERSISSVTICPCRFLSVVTSGIIVLFALGDLKPEEDAQTKQNLEATSISITNLEPEDLRWKKFSLRI